MSLINLCIGVFSVSSSIVSLVHYRDSKEMVSLSLFVFGLVVGLVNIHFFLTRYQ